MSRVWNVLFALNCREPFAIFNLVLLKKGLNKTAHALQNDLFPEGNLIV